MERPDATWLGTPAGIRPLTNGLRRGRQASVAAGTATTRVREAAADVAVLVEASGSYRQDMATTDGDTHNDEVPATDDRDPALLVPEAVAEVLRLAASWLRWDGTPAYGDENVWTPHKAMRRVCDHLLDHLAEIDALVAGAPSLPDTWRGRTVTLDCDWARFTEADLDEARSRLLRYAELYRLRLQGLAPDLDRPRAEGWTVRQIAHHVSQVTYYARQVGDLTPAAGGAPAR